MRADDLLALGRPSLLPLIALTTIERPAETMPQVVAAIRAEPDAMRQRLLLGQLLALLRDEEVIAMTQQLLTEDDLEELKQFPLLWRSYQETIAHERQRARAYILEVLAARFAPHISAYQRAEQALAAIEDDDQLSAYTGGHCAYRTLRRFLASLGNRGLRTE
jgi:hypothetical protein